LAILETIDRLPALGLERSPAGMMLRVNVAIGMIRTGRLHAAEAVIEQALALEPSSNVAVEALTMHGWVLDLRGRRDEANAALARARDGAGRGALRRSLGDLCWVEAHTAILDGRIDEAVDLLREGTPYVEGGSLVIEYAWLELLVAVARALDARRSRDGVAERSAIESARTIVDQIRGLEVSLGGGMPWVSHHVMPLLAGELDRATGTSDPEVWRIAADELERAHFRWDAAYALYRRAEAVAESNAAESDIAAAIETAKTAAAAIGAGGIVEWTAELRERAAR
jgi:tetratricopeptide (TPR) repeat protein